MEERYIEVHDFMAKIANFVQTSKAEMNELTKVTQKIDKCKQKIGGLGATISEKSHLMLNRNISNDDRNALYQEMSDAINQENKLIKEVEGLATRKDQLLKELEEKIVNYKKSIKADPEEINVVN